MLDDGFIRLNRNENPFGPSPEVEEVIRRASSSANRYPVDNPDRCWRRSPA